LSPTETRTYARLRNADYVRRFRVLAGLGAGEAAAIAIAASRSWQLATDDEDGIRVAQALIARFQPLRIRKLLQLAVQNNHCSAQEARAIHRAMLEVGFWDTGHL
jgi:predicted nucleic acid-binding protein